MICVERVVEFATYLGRADATGGGVSASDCTSYSGGPDEATASEYDTSDGTVSGSVGVEKQGVKYGTPGNYCFWL